MAALKPIKDNEESVTNYGIHLGPEMCKILSNEIQTLHLYTLNMKKKISFSYSDGCFAYSFLFFVVGGRCMVGGGGVVGGVCGGLCCVVWG